MRICITAFCLVLLQGLHLTIGSSSEPITPSQQHRGLENRVIGGTAAKLNRYPYYTYIKFFYEFGNPSWCGASLIAPDVVMTAAHCIEGRDDGFFGGSDGIIGVDVFVNSTTVKYSKFEYYRTGIKWVVPSGRDIQMKKDDIALIFLDTPVMGVTPVKLNRNANIPDSVNPPPLTVVGLGVNGVNKTDDFFFSSSAFTYPDQLMQATLDPIPVPACKKTYSSYFVGDHNICTAGVTTEKKGPCYGDSGGPLLMTKSVPTEDVQIGIVSWGDSCEFLYPEVFTRVSFYTKWIDGQICQFSKNKPSTCPIVKPSPPTRNPTKKPTKKPAALSPVFVPTRPN